MKFTLLSTVLAAVASAAPAPAPAAPSPNAFGIMSLRSASPIHFGSVHAAKSGILINRKNGSEAKCPAGNDNAGYAIFYIKDGGLYLYGNGKKAQTQQLYVDRSGMGTSFPFGDTQCESNANMRNQTGQGKFGYITGDQSPPRNAELKGFKVDENGYLSFKDTGFIACPGQGGPQAGGWSVWVSAGVTNPGGNTGCLGFTPMTLPQDKPAKCQYSK